MSPVLTPDPSTLPAPGLPGAAGWDVAVTVLASAVLVSTVLAVLALTALAGVLGRRVLSLATPPGEQRGDAPGPETGYRRLLAVLAGLLLLHLLLQALHLAGVRWTVPSLALTLAATWGGLVVWGRLLGRSPGRGDDAGATPPGWGEALAGLGVTGFAVAALTLRATHPDFVYHWGIKGQKFLLAGGPDVTYLARPWNHYIHPDYPRFLPELYAITALPAGEYAERGLLLWSVLAFLGLGVAFRQATLSARLSPAVRQTALAVVMLAIAAFATGHRLAGGADLPLALAVAMALPPLLTRRPGPPHDLALGLAAAAAVAAKMEGLPLAATLVVLYGIHRWRRSRPLRRAATPGDDIPVPSPVGGILRTLLPALLIALPWLFINLRHGLFQATNSAGFEGERWRAVAGALREALAVPHWHGMAWILLAAPPLLLSRRARPLAVLVLVQLAFYGWIYFTMVGDPAILVRFSFPRLALPLVIPTALGLALLLDGSTAHRPRPTPATEMKLPAAGRGEGGSELGEPDGYSKVSWEASPQMSPGSLVRTWEMPLTVSVTVMSYSTSDRPP